MTTIFDELIDNFEKDDRISKLYRFEGGKSFSKLSNGSFGFDNVGGYTYFSKSLKHHQYFMSKRLKQLINENVLNGTNLIVSKNNLVNNGSFNIILSKLDHCSNIHSLYSLELLTDPFILVFIKDNALIQEVKQHSMYSDIPEYKLENKLRENIYKVNPRRVDIGGTVESINNITKEDLYLCYNNFYSPNNMFLLVVGNFDKDTTLDVIKKEMEFISNRGTPTIKTIKEPDKVNKQYEEITNDHINLDKVEIGLKLNYSKFKFDEKILDLYLNMITSIKCGHSSLFREYIRENNICNNIYYEWETSFMHKVLYIMGNCMNSDEFIKEVKKEFNNDKISEEDFKRIKKVWISNIVRHYDDVEGCLDSLYDDIIRYGDIIEDKIKLIKNLKYKDLISVYKRIDFNNISVVKMIGKE